MRRYQPESGTHKTQKREQLFRKLEEREYRYHHNIPAKSIGQALRSQGLTAEEHTGGTKSRVAYGIHDKQNRVQGYLTYNKKTKKVDHWFVR